MAVYNNRKLSKKNVDNSRRDRVLKKTRIKQNKIKRSKNFEENASFFKFRRLPLGAKPAEL